MNSLAQKCREIGKQYRAEAELAQSDRSDQLRRTAQAWLITAKNAELADRIDTHIAATRWFLNR